MASFKYGCFCVNSLATPDKLANPDLPFSIAYAFGDRDWVGSDGAESIVKANKYFDTGISQIFSIPESDHLTYLNNSDALVQKMIGFFKQTTTHEFVEHPRTLYPQPREEICSKQFESRLPTEPEVSEIKNKFSINESIEFSLITQMNASLLLEVDDLNGRKHDNRESDLSFFSFFSSDASEISIPTFL